MTQIKSENSQDDEAGKLFVGGLSWETSQEKLQEYFGAFGEVVDCVVMKNTETGRSRGFGFVTFKDQSAVAKVLSNGPHELDKRTIDPKVCSSRGAQKTGSKKSNTMPKVFLGGLPTNCTETDIRSFFSRYGNVNEVVLMYDQEKKKSRGFGFLSFESEDSVKQVCAEHYVKINGKQVECKHAEPRDKNSRMPKSNPPGNQWGGPGMSGPGWGPSQGPAGPGGQMPMNNNMMGGNYQGGWGGGPQQPGPYGPQGGWGPQQQGYGQNYGQNWGGPGYGGPYGGGSGPGPQYGQGFGNYGPGGGGYTGGYGGNYNAPAAGPQGQPGPTGDGYSGPVAGPASNVGGPPGAAAGPAVDPGIGTYNQDNSSYGPNRGYGSSSGGNSSYGSGSYGASSSYNQGGSYGGGQGNFSGPSDAVITPVRSGGGGGSSQGYHPYRR